MVGAVDDFSAGEAFGFFEVEEEVVEFSGMGEGASEGLGHFIWGDLGAEDDEGIDVEGFGEVTEFDAVFFGFKDGVAGVWKLSLIHI